MLKNNCDSSPSALGVGTNDIVSSAVSLPFLSSGESRVISKLGRRSKSRSDER